MSHAGRKLAVVPQKIADLNTIKQATAAKTDSAAMNDAISFRARFAREDAAKVTVALALYEALKKEVLQGAEVVTQKPDDPQHKKFHAVPVL